MKSTLCITLLAASIVICFAQTPVAEGPEGRVGQNPDPDLPELYADPYEPPPMKLVPAGEFEMGDHLGTGYYDELPVHAVYIDAFYMDVFEVTVKEYCTYLNAALSRELIEVRYGVVYKKDAYESYCDTILSTPTSPITWNGRSFGVVAARENHPMVFVTWYGAAAYANWRSGQKGLTPCYNLASWECSFGVGGYRLPTEAEWEKAARGGEHAPYYDYPWGNSIDGSMANYWQSGDPYEGTWPGTTPVGYYDGNQVPPGADMANGYGLYDMAGNVCEFCNDWYDDNYYQYCVDHGIYFNPTGPAGSVFFARVRRGGSWLSEVIDLRCATRWSTNPGYRLSGNGFRLILEIQETDG